MQTPGFTLCPSLLGNTPNSGLCLVHTCFILFGSNMKIVFRIKAQFCPLICFIKHYMLFLSSFSTITPGHALQTPLVGLVLLISTFMVSCSHKIKLTFDVG